jgi:hypothetical protein
VKEFPSQYLIHTWFQLFICGLSVASLDMAPDWPAIAAAGWDLGYFSDVPRSLALLLKQSCSERHHPPPCWWIYHEFAPDPEPGEM